MEKTDRELLEELLLNITCYHIDMSGKHEYHLCLGAHEIIQEIKYKLWKENN
jgi:hypothetical protein